MPGTVIAKVAVCGSVSPWSNYCNETHVHTLTQPNYKLYIKNNDILHMYQWMNIIVCMKLMHPSYPKWIFFGKIITSKQIYVAWVWFWILANHLGAPASLPQVLSDFISLLKVCGFPGVVASGTCCPAKIETPNIFTFFNYLSGSKRNVHLDELRSLTLWLTASLQKGDVLQSFARSPHQ